MRNVQWSSVVDLQVSRLVQVVDNRWALAKPLAFVVAGYEEIVGAGVVALRGEIGFFFACAMLVACAGFLVALVRAVQRSIPCACFGRLGKTAAGGREIGRGITLVAGAAFLLVHRALDAGASYGVGPLAAA